MASDFDETAYRSLYEHSEDAILVATADGELLAANPAACRLFGRTQAELRAVGRAGMVDASDPRVAAFLAARSTDGRARAEIGLRRADDTRFDADVTSAVYRDSAGQTRTVVIARDLSARKRLEQEKSQYFRFFMLSDDPMCVADPFGCFTAVNPAFVEMLGYSEDELLARPFLDFVEDADRASTAREMQLQVGERASLNFRNHYVRKDGRVILLSWKAYFDATDRQTYALARDITESDRAEAALRESEARYRSVVATMAEGLVFHGADGSVVATNPAGQRILGRFEDAIVGHRAEEAQWAAIHEDGSPFPGEEHPTSVTQRTRQPQSNVVMGVRTSGGERRWLSINAMPVGDDAGAGAGGVIATFRDITQQRRSEAEIRKLSLAVEQSPESIMITNLDGVIEYVNEACVRVSGYSRNEMIGETASLLKSGRTPRSTYALLWDRLARGQSWSGQFVNRRKDGSEYTESAIITPILAPHGVVTHYLAIKADVTEQRQMAAELEQHRLHLEELVAQRTAELAEARAQADAANVAKSAFLANMSHEIRTPMNAILGLTHLLRRSSPTTEQAASLDKIVLSARHLLSLIDDILDLSKIEAGKMTVEHTDFHLSSVLKDVVEIVRARAEEKGLALKYEVAPGLPLILKGDPLRLQQILLNLGTNAVKFTEHGSVAIGAALSASDDPQIAQIRFEVRDTGIGLDMAQRARLFQPFQQADASTTRRFGGSGLGLVICRRLVDLLGGTIGLTSEPGVGSTFWFTLPLERSDATVRSAWASGVIAPFDAAEPTRTLHILLVEDDAINQEVACELLRSVGHSVDVAANGQQAIERAAQHAYDLVLMDVQMPIMDGLDATRRLREMPKYARTPILAMTANAFHEDRARCMEAGMDDFIAKPVDPDRMFATIQRWGVEPGRARVPDAVSQDSELLRQRISAIAGLQVALGLRSVQGRWPSYERFLDRFANDHQADLAEIRGALASGHRDDARRVAHTLKGLAATLGAVEVQAAAAELEGALRDGATTPFAVALLIEALEGVHDKLGTALREVLPQESAPVAMAVDWQAVRSAMGHIEALLVDDDPRALAAVNDAAPQLRAALGPVALELEARVAKFQFEEALVLLRTAVNAHEELVGLTTR